MTIESSKKTLNRAQAELHSAKDDEQMRQAAEKAWRAAREAVYAVMSVVGEAPKESTLSASTVAAFEVRFLGRGRTRFQPLSAGYARAIHILHGAYVFTMQCSKEALETEMSQVAWLIEQAEEDSIALGFSRRKKRRK